MTVSSSGVLPACDIQYYLRTHGTKYPVDLHSVSWSNPIGLQTQPVCVGPRCWEMAGPVFWPWAFQSPDALLHCDQPASSHPPRPSWLLHQGSAGGQVGKCRRVKSKSLDVPIKVREAFVGLGAEGGSQFQLLLLYV